MPSPLSPEQQFAALSVLDLLCDLVSASPLRVYSQEQVIDLLLAVRSDVRVFDAEVAAAQLIASSAVAVDDLALTN